MNDVRELEYIDPQTIAIAERNPRQHTKQQIAMVCKLIKKYTFTNPLLIDENGRLLAGHCRRLAAIQLGLQKVPCIRLVGMSEAEKTAYIIADNAAALAAGWDYEILSDGLIELGRVGYDLELTGFEYPEIDEIFSTADRSSTRKRDIEDADALPSSDIPTVTRLGDHWQLGRHHLLCGDAKEPDAFACVMDGAQAAAVFTDSPYNLNVVGNVSGLGKVKHREFAEASGEMTPTEFAGFLSVTFENIERVCRNGAIVYTCMDWRHLLEILTAGGAVFGELKNICVWAKTNAGMGTFYRSQHEMVLVWKVGDAPHTNNFGLGSEGRYRTNLWTYPGVNTFKADRLAELQSHPTVKPVAMVADAICDVTQRGEIVLDPFGGSGTTLIACEKVGRLGRLIEIDPAYCDVTIRRWQMLTGKQAILDGTSESFEDVQEARVAEAASTCQGAEQ